MCNKFDVDWTSTSSILPRPKTWSGTDGRTNRRTNERTHRPENEMPINGA